MMSSSRNVIAPYFHAFVCLHHFTVMIVSHVKVSEMRNATDQRVSDMEKFGPIFFTTWNMVFQTVYFTLAMAYDVLQILSIRQDLQEKIKKHKGYIFNSLMFPSTPFVAAMFWSLYSLNREFVFPEIVDQFLPKWMNHCVHTNIVIFLLIEVLITNQQRPTAKSAFLGVTTMLATYHFVIVSAYFLTGRWVYAIFNIFSWPERVLFMSFNSVVAIITMTIGLHVQDFKHSLSEPHGIISKARANSIAFKESAKLL